MKKNKIVLISVIAGAILVICGLLYWFLGTGRNDMWNTSDKLKTVSGLKATFNDTDGSVNLTWNAMKGVDGYRLYRSPLSKTEFTLLGTTKTNGFNDTNTSTNTSTNTDAGDTYQYIVQAYTGEGNSALYGPYVGIMAGKNVTAPTGMTAKLTADGTQLSWKPVEGVKGYKVFRSENYGTGYKGIVANCTTTTYSDTSAKNKTYCYKVAGFIKVKGVTIYTAASTPGYDSEALKAIGPGLAASGNVTVTKTDGGMVISWQAVEGADGYKVFRSAKPGKDYKGIINSTKELTFTDTKLESGKTYYYKVEAFKKYGSESYFGSASVPATVK